jgi:hypothetical protein
MASSCLLALPSIKLVLPICAHRGGVGIHLGAEVAQADERLGFAGVLEGHASFRAVFGAEVFVLGQFVEADELRAVQRLTVDRALALHADQAVGAGVLEGDLHARIHGEFFGGEELFAIDLAVDDPAVDETFLSRVGHGHGLQVVVVLEFRVHVLRPVELVHDEVEVLVLAPGHVLHEQAPRHVTALDHALVHAEDVAAPLRLVGAEAARRVQDARVDQPAGSDFKRKLPI